MIALLILAAYVALIPIVAGAMNHSAESKVDRDFAVLAGFVWPAILPFVLVCAVLDRLAALTIMPLFALGAHIAKAWNTRHSRPVKQEIARAQAKEKRS